MSKIDETFLGATGYVEFHPVNDGGPGVIAELRWMTFGHLLLGLYAASSQDMYARGMEYAEQNVHAAFDFAQKLARAGSLSEAMQLQAEFARGQFAAMQSQAKEFGGIAQGAMREGAEQAKGAMQEGADQTRKAFEQGRDAAEQTAHDAGQAVDQATH